MSIKSFITIAVTATITGCAAAPLVVTGMGIGSVAVTETTGRTATDHVVSAANGGQDCRVGRVLRNQEVCQPDGTVKLQVTTTGVTPSTVEEIQKQYR